MKNMMKRAKEKMQCMVLRGKLEFKDFMDNQRGASDMVAVIVLIVIVIGIAAILKEPLLEIAQTVIDKLKEFVG